MSCNHLNDCSRCGGIVDDLEEMVESLEAKVNRLSKGFSNHFQPTPSMIEEGAKRLLRWQDDSVWPDSWEPLQIVCAKNDAERVWRGMWLMAQTERKRE